MLLSMFLLSAFLSSIFLPSTFLLSVLFAVAFSTFFFRSIDGTPLPLTIYFMVERSPTVHPLFTAKKAKQTESRKEIQSTDIFPTSMNDAYDVSSEEIADDDSSLVVVDDEPEENASSSFVDDQPDIQLSKCELVCCTSSTVYVAATASELQSTSIKGKRSCQASWFNIYSWLTFCKVCCY